MTVYLYVHEEGGDVKNHIAIVQKYAKEQKLGDVKVIEDSTPTKVQWKGRSIGSILGNSKAGDQILVYEAAQLACSTSQILEILSVASKRNVPLHLVKHQGFLRNDKDTVDTQYMLTLISKIESDFISKRTTQALARRKAAGLPLGRPKGRANKSLKLDKHKSDIKKYLTLGISKASIAKLVNCHPQTLYDWLERHNINVESAAADVKELA